MRLIVILGMIFISGCGRSLDQESVRDFQQAEQAFDSAKCPTDFLLAASLYQRIVDRGAKSGAVFYNQGNAYMRGGQRGRAIACYRQAKRYLPRDPQLDANLQYALKGARSIPTDRSMVDYVFFWQDWLSYPGKFRFAIFSGALCLVVALANLHWKWPILRHTALAILLVTSIAICSAIYDWYRVERIRHGVVTSPETVARKGNSESYESAFTTPLPEGTEFTVREQRGNWVRIELPAGEQGWIKIADAVLY